MQVIQESEEEEEEDTIHAGVEGDHSNDNDDKSEEREIVFDEMSGSGPDWDPLETYQEGDNIPPTMEQDTETIHNEEPEVEAEAEDIGGNDGVGDIDSTGDEVDDNDEHPDDEKPTTTRSGRVSKAPTQYEPTLDAGQKYPVATSIEIKHNLLTQAVMDEQKWEYDKVEAAIMAQVMDKMNNDVEFRMSFGQQHILQKGLKLYKDRGYSAAMKELEQLHSRVCFVPVKMQNLSDAEKRHAMPVLMFLTEKRDGTIKGRMVANGAPTREWLSNEDSASPTASVESILLTGVIEAHEGRNVLTLDVPNAFIQAQMPEVKPGEERVVMKITGVIVDMLVNLDPKTYKGFVVYERGMKVCLLYTSPSPRDA